MNARGEAFCWMTTHADGIEHAVTDDAQVTGIEAGAGCACRCRSSSARETRGMTPYTTAGVELLVEREAEADRPVSDEP